MRHIDNDVLGLVGIRKGVLVETSPLGSSQLNGDAGAQEGLIVPYLSDLAGITLAITGYSHQNRFCESYIGFGSCVIVVCQRVGDLSQYRHLRDNTVLYQKVACQTHFNRSSQHHCPLAEGAEGIRLGCRRTKRSATETDPVPRSSPQEEKGPAIST